MDKTTTEHDLERAKDKLGDAARDAKDTVKDAARKIKHTAEDKKDDLNEAKESWDRDRVKEEAEKTYAGTPERR